MLRTVSAVCVCARAWVCVCGGARVASRCPFLESQVDGFRGDTLLTPSLGKINVILVGRSSPVGYTRIAIFAGGFGIILVWGAPSIIEDPFHVLGLTRASASPPFAFLQMSSTFRALGLK